MKARLILIPALIAAKISAATFHPIDSITSSTDVSDFYGVGGLINGSGSGYDASPPHNQLTTLPVSQRTWVTDACGFPCDYYDSFSAPVLVVDLGADRPLHEISLWGYQQSNTNGVKNASLRFATDSEGTSFGASITFSPIFSVLNDDVVRQSFSFGQTVTARYVEITLIDNHFVFPGDGSLGGGAGGDRVGLGEVAFATPPESGVQVIATAPNDFSLKAGNFGDSALASIVTEGNFWSAERIPGTTQVLLSLPTDGKIIKFDLGDSPIVESTLVDLPEAVFHGLAINEEDGILYAADSKSDTILKFDLDSGTAMGSIGANFSRPNEVIFDAPGDRLYVSDSGNDEIVVYTSSGGLVARLDNPTTQGVWGLVLDPANGDLLYSSHDLGRIYRRAALGGAISLEHENLSGPRGLGYDQEGRLYCLESGASQVTTFGVSPLTTYSLAPGGRDIITLDQCDLDNDFLPDSWEAASGGPGLTFLSDPEGDGKIAGLEAATGGSALTNDGSNPVTLVRDPSGEFTVSYQVLKKGPLVYQLSLSSDLMTWKAARSIPATEEGGGLYDRKTFRFTAADEGFPAGAEKIFVRLGVSAPGL